MYPPVRVHFLHHPEDVVIKVSLENRRAHDIIIVYPDSTPKELYSAVHKYMKALTRDELRALSPALSTYPQPMDAHQKAIAP
jgi:hypothetical protein